VSPPVSSLALAPAVVPAETTLTPAPSQPIARAARAFGDAYPPVRQWPIRVAGVLLIASIVFYAPWLWRSMNRSLPWLSWPYVLANAFTLANWLLSVVNAWSRWVPEPRRVAAGAEPVVGVIIPTCGEPVPMVLRTIVSVLEQDWPRDRLVVVVSDDGHDPELEAAVEHYGVVYHSPPPRFAAGRDGAAKSGNLNSALALLDEIAPGVAYVETRDADDELPSLGFLRHAVGQLEADGGLAYVQTIKEAQVSPGDPFNNRDTTFYRSQLLARNAANAVFPCGSGLVWRRTALHDIGEFPTWNLVEHLQSGVEALRRGWRGLYVPIVGAVPQHSPEDVPNFYKQRGSWALDTVRLIVWRGLRGLNLRQRAQFLELFCFYLSGFTVLAYVPAIICALLGWMPLQTSAWGFAVHMLPIALAIELWLLTLTAPYNDRRRRQRRIPRPVAGADNVGGARPRLHEGDDPGGVERPEAQADVQGDAQVRRQALALAAHAPADDDRGLGRRRARLRPSLRRLPERGAVPRLRLLGRAEHHPAQQLHHPQLVRPLQSAGASQDHVRARLAERSSADRIGLDD
jgi:cellulose synthase/poly-beta-1,6-N-acetylglucosamine synthase-like glycosyltransferase